MILYLAEHILQPHSLSAAQPMSALHVANGQHDTVGTKDRKPASPTNCISKGFLYLISGCIQIREGVPAARFGRRSGGGPW